MQNMPRRRRNIIPLVRRIRRRKVRIRIQRIGNPALGPWSLRRRRRNGRHSRLTPGTLEESRLLLLLGIIVRPAPFRAQVLVDEIDAPPSFLFDFVEDVECFFLLAAHGEVFAGDGEAADGS
jgi:hypothetical protein